MTTNEIQKFIIIIFFSHFRGENRNSSYLVEETTIFNFSLTYKKKKKSTIYPRVQRL